MKPDDLPLGVPNSSQSFLEDFTYDIDHHHNQFHPNGSSSSNPVFEVHFDTFDNFDVYECKPFSENNNGKVVMDDDFEYGN